MSADEVLVTWRDCDCEWATKYCDEEHVKHAIVPRSVLHGDPQPDARQCPATRADGYRCQAFTAHDKHVDSLGRMW